MLVHYLANIISFTITLQEKAKFLAGEEYSIADIATFPWIARHPIHDIGLKKFKNLSRWYEKISQRESVIKGYDILKQGDKIPKI